MFLKTFKEMSDHELKLAVLRLALADEPDAEHKRLIVEAEEEQMRRILAAPKPGETDVRTDGKAA
jgi:hypothetical protein